MRIFPVIVKRIVESSAGFLASVVSVGISLTYRYTLLATEVLVGIFVDPTRFTFRGPTQAPGLLTSLLGVTGEPAKPEHAAGFQAASSLRDVATTGVSQATGVGVAQAPDVAFTGPNQTPGFAASPLSATGAPAKPEHTPSLAVSAVISEFHLNGLPAFEMVRIQYDLTRRVGGNASADVSGTWTNRANAQGTHDGSTATSAGAALGSSRKMRLDYANHTNKSALTISLVRLHVYAAVTGDTTGLLSTATFSYNVGAGETNLEAAIAGNFDNLGTPRTYDITSAVGGNWANLDAIQTFANHVYQAASLGIQCAVDAIELEVVASLTQTEGGNP